MIDFLNKFESLKFIKITYLFLIGIIIVVGSVVPLFFALGTWFPKLNKLLITEHNILIYIFAGLVLGYVFFKKIYEIELSNKIFLFIISIITLLGAYFKFKYVFTYEQDFYSDFRTMWNYAINIYNQGFIYPDRPQTERPLAFLVPLVSLFGTSESIFKISNIVLILSSSLIFTYMVSQTISKQAAILFLMIILSVPEVYFTSLIPTHDIPGIFYQSLYLLIMYQIFTNINSISKVKLAIYILLLGMIGLLLDIQRGTYTVTVLVLLLVLILYFIFNFKQINKMTLIKILLILFVPLFLQLSTKTILKSNEFLVDHNSNIYGHFWPLAHQHTFSNGTFGKARYIWDNFGKELFPNDFESLNYMKKALMFSDLYYNISERPSNYVLRSKRLLSLGTQSEFYYGRLNNITKSEQSVINKFNSQWNTAFTTFYILLLFISTVCFVFTKHKDSKNIVYFPLIFMSIAAMALLLIGEHQPRYLFMGWFLWSIVIVWFIDELFTEKEIENKNKYLFSNKGLLYVFGLTVVAYVIFKLLFSYSEYKLIDMSKWNALKCNDEVSDKECKKAIVPFKHSLDDKYYSTLIMQLPRYPKKHDFVSNTKVFEVSKDKLYTLSTYIMSPYFREDGRKGYFDINIIVNGEKKHTQHIADSEDYKYIKLEDIKPDENAEIIIELQIVSNVDYGAASWQKASKVYFKFASLRGQKNNE